MTLGEALGLIRQQKDQSRSRKVFLVCGFQPLHLGTLLQGHLARRFPDDRADIQTGLYGDLEGNLKLAAASDAEAATIAIEWSDIDPRLGLRSAGGWALSLHADILDSCRDKLKRLLAGLAALEARMPVVLSPPTLPYSVIGHTPGAQSSVIELELGSLLAGFLVEAGRLDRVSVLNPNSLGIADDVASRLDASMELRAGFPYTVPHASAIASQMAKLLYPASPMKGLITDLDDTFWSGIVGEVGVAGVSWSLADHSAAHGLYQQMLAHLSEMGVLLAIASKNEQSVVDEALKRSDLLAPAKSFFPVFARWGPKSDSIAGILRAWNISADSVVFVDDSAMELEEVRTAFPAITCLQFPAKTPGKVVELLRQLRDAFGKPAIQREDALRQASIRANAEFESAEREGPGGEFLRGLRGMVTFDCRKDPSNKRLLELINKTNQFNLNGERISEGEWLKLLEDRSAVVVGVSYEDKFGQMGTIGVMAGRKIADSEVELSSWVLSCRAFSRQIETHMLEHLFSQYGAQSVRIAVRSTERNQPLRSYLATLGVDIEPAGPATISRNQIQHQIEELPHHVRLQE